MSNKSLQQKLELDGMTDPEGRVGRPLFSEVLSLPEDIRVDGDCLTWRTSRINFVSPPVGMLDSFLRLARAETSRPFERFARKYGIFGAALLPLGGPRAESEILLPDAGIEGENPSALRCSRWAVSTRMRPRGKSSEPLIFWKQFARAAVAMLEIAMDLNREPPKPGSEENWRSLGPFTEDDLVEAAKSSVEAAKEYLFGTLESWMSAGRVVLRVAPLNFHDEKRPRWEPYIGYGSMDTYSLFGVLATQLALAVARADGLYFCTGCRLPYIRARGTRRPKPGNNNYCEECRGKSGKDQARRYARDRFRQKQSEARRLHSKGVPVEQIAKRLGARDGVQSVRKWVGLG